MNYMSERIVMHSVVLLFALHIGVGLATNSTDGLSTNSTGDGASDGAIPTWLGIIIGIVLFLGVTAGLFLAVTGCDMLQTAAQAAEAKAAPAKAVPAEESSAVALPLMPPSRG